MINYLINGVIISTICWIAAAIRTKGLSITTYVNVIGIPKTIILTLIGFTISTLIWPVTLISTSITMLLSLTTYKEMYNEIINSNK